MVFFLSSDHPLVLSSVASGQDERAPRRSDNAGMKSGLLAIAVFALTPFTSGGQEIPRAGTVVPPRAVKSVRALYTPQARNAGIEGTVLVDAVVLTDGSVRDDVKVTQSLDTEFGLDDQAVKASKQWKFQPATKDGKPVQAHVVIEHVFSLQAEK